MKTLITGGLGFIGSTMVRRLLADPRQEKIILVDKRTYAGKIENIQECLSDRRLSLEIIDIADRDGLSRILESEHIDRILNFAAETHVDRSIADPYPFIHTNLDGLNNLLSLSRKYGVNTFVQISTDEVYGPRDLNGGKPAREGDPLNPTSPYAASKAGGDLLALSYFKTYGLDVRITRSSNCFGPRQYPEKLIPLTIKKILQGLPVPIYGTGKNLRDWLHVEDDCTGILLVAEKGEKGGIYNISAHCEKTALEVVQTIGRVMERPPLLDFVQDRKGHDTRYLIDTDKIEKLGFKPQYNFDKDIRDVVKSYL